MKKNKLSILLFVSALIIPLCGWLIATNDQFIKITRNLEIFSKVYRIILLQYVEEIDPGEFMEYGIHSMLEALDPYTMFYSSEAGDVDLLTSGSRAGIGIRVIKRDNSIVVSEVLEGYAALREGIRVGDMIHAVDSMRVSNLSDVFRLVNGEPATQVKLEISRPGRQERLVLPFTREPFQLINIPISAMLDDSIGYIRLTRFEKNAGEDLRKELSLLKKSGMKRLILDLRGNPGGRLDEAVQVTSKFIPEKKPVVTIRGRNEESKEEFLSEGSPVWIKEPLVVLIDSLSASASEIVAGALQDYDRAIIAGTQSFGKGLVQTFQPVAWETSLRITTARYYTPSGRCIQAQSINSFSESDTSETPKIFKTSNGRLVREGSGIQPDTVLFGRPIPPIIAEMKRKSVFFRFAEKFPELSGTNTEIKDFIDFLFQERIFRELTVFESLKTFREESFPFLKAQKTDSVFNSMEKDLIQIVGHAMQSDRELVTECIREEQLKRKYPLAEVFKKTATNDRQLQAAIHLISIQ